MDKRTCSVIENGVQCGAPHNGRGYCAPHYQRWYRWGDPLASGPIRIRGRKCSFGGCENDHSALGYCSGHWKQLAESRELKPLRPMWNGAECTAEPDCHDPILAQGYCGKHYQAWRLHGDPLIKLPPGREGSRKYTLNDSYFDEITTQEQAYWLGFIAADGGVVINAKTYALRFELAECDAEQVQLFAQAMGSDKPLWHRRGCAGISLDSWRLVESLGRIGITQRKSATVQPWDGPADLMPHYWRGLFDGDGSIYRVGSRTDWCLNICGSSACVEGFADWAKPIAGSRAKPRRVREGATCWAWAVTGGRKPQLLAEALYADATVALARKQELATQLRAVDYDARRTEANLRRKATMQEAWATGRHPRARRVS